MAAPWRAAGGSGRRAVDDSSTAPTGSEPHRSPATAADGARPGARGVPPRATVPRPRGVRRLATKQEHHDLGEISALDYIVSQLPEYARLKHIIDTYPDTMGDNMRKISEYSDALNIFSEKGYC